MIPAIMWKEWRDQRTIACTILVFGALALGLTAQFVVEASGQNIMESAGARELMALAVAYLAGSVCGSMLLADDKEVGTIEFLDGLPCTRRSLWIGKATYGLSFTFAMCALIAGLALAFDCTDSRVSSWTYALFIVMAGLHGFAWGLFGGALASSTLGAVFQGAVGSFVIGTIVAIPFAFIVGPMGFGRTFSPSLFLFYAAWMSSGLALSALVFTSIDRRRQSFDSSETSGSHSRVSKPKRSWRPRFTSLVWLSVRQGLWVTLSAWAAGLIFGSVMISPDAIPLMVWPLATLLIGALAGVTVLSEEQTKGVARFWAEHRLPLGRLWLTKVALHFLMASVAALIMSAPLFAVSPTSPFRTVLLQQFDMGLRGNLGMFLWFGLVYGFVMGHLSGMLFRKTIVAGLFAVLTSVILAGFLVPSLIGGGINRWQMWLPALLLLLTARALLYPWATERIAFRGPVLRACAGVALALAVLVAGIGYRVYEIPDSPDRLAESGYVESLPAFDSNDSGRLTRSIAGQYRKASEDAQALFPARPAGAASNAAPGIDRTLLERAASTDWTTPAQTLKPWLDQVFSENEDWPNRLVELDRKPPGLFEDPRELHHFSPMDDVRNLREMLLAIRVRGLQRQAEGDSESYARLLRGGLAAVRNARYRGTWRTPETALECEDILLGGLFVWLEKLEGRAELLRDVLALLIRHEREMQTGVEDVFWAERVVLANTFQRISTWLPLQLDRRQRARPSGRPPSESEAELVSVAWNIPWERARRERLLRLNMDTESTIPFSWMSGLHLKHRWGLERWGRLKERDRRGLTLRRFACIRVALNLFELERGRPADTLNQLVPDFLPAVPRDPFSAGYFGYRLSQGEVVEYEFNLRIGSMSRPDLVLSALGPALVHFENFATALPLLVQAAQPPTLVVQMAFGTPNTVPPVSPITVKRIVPRGTGILWSTGVDGVDHGGKHNGPLGWGDGPNVDWILLVPPAKRTPLQP